MILISTQCFPPASGGIETLMYSLSNALAMSGERVQVFADKYSSADSQLDSQQAYPVYRYGGLKAWRRRKKARELFLYSQEHRESQLFLITDSWKSLEHVDTRYFNKVLCLAHGTEFPEQATASKTARIKRSLEKANYIIANSDYTAKRLSDHVADQQKIRVIYPGITIGEEEPATDLKISEQCTLRAPVLITLARLERRKGQLSIICILSRLIEKYPDLLYVIAGEGSLRGELETAVQHLGLNKHVIFTGKLDGAYKSAWLRHSTLFVMPGSTVGQDVEGFGMAYIDAACFGIPSIACNVGGAPEAVLHRQTGLVIEPENADTLTQAIFELLDNRLYCKQLGENARERAKEFLWQNKCIEYLNLLRQ